MNTKLLDPTETDQSELIIDPENITQWVDNKLPTPHKVSIELLAEKFSSLNDYYDDVKEERKLLKEAFSSHISAPANTICRVLLAIQDNSSCQEIKILSKEASEATMPITGDSDQASESRTKTAPVLPVKKNYVKSADSLPFEIEFPQQKKKRSYFIFPIAAVLLLSLVVGAITFTENYSGHTSPKHKKAVAVKKEKPIHFRKAVTMEAPTSTPHSVPVAEDIHMALDDEVSSPHERDASPQKLSPDTPQKDQNSTPGEKNNEVGKSK